MTAALTLGPLLFHWPADQVRDFYARIADEAPVDCVCLGETVCAKRMPFVAPHLPEIIERLEAAGKEVVLATLALVATPREWTLMDELVRETDYLVEANDVGLAHRLAGRPHAIGPLVNIYNEETLAFFAARGATRVCLPPELPFSSISSLARQAEPQLEVQVFGRVPLAISARCFHARAHGRHKDACQFACGDDADGLAVRTLDDEPFLAINGTQTLSHTFLNLLAEIASLRAAGVRRFRLSPHAADMVRVADIFRRVVDGHDEPRRAGAELARIVPSATFANGFFHGTAGRRLAAPADQGE